MVGVFFILDTNSDVSKPLLLKLINALRNRVVGSKQDTNRAPIFRNPKSVADKRAPEKLHFGANFKEIGPFVLFLFLFFSK
jgi:hypothetical protein